MLILLRGIIAAHPSYTGQASGERGEREVREDGGEDASEEGGEGEEEGEEE